MSYQQIQGIAGQKKIVYVTGDGEFTHCGKNLYDANGGIFQNQWFFNPEEPDQTISYYDNPKVCMFGCQVPFEKLNFNVSSMTSHFGFAGLVQVIEVGETVHQNTNTPDKNNINIDVLSPYPYLVYYGLGIGDQNNGITQQQFANSIQVEIGESKTDYESYSGNTISVTAGQQFEITLKQGVNNIFGSALFEIGDPPPPEYTGTQAKSPTVKSNTGGAVELNPQNISGEIVEYGINTNTMPPTEWQTLTTFAGLADDDYYFFARVQANNAHLAGEIAISDKVVVSSQKPSYTGQQATAPQITNNNDGTIFITPQTISGEIVEYGINTTTTTPTTWTNSNVFSNLTDGEYYFFARVQENSEHLAGAVAISAKITIDIPTPPYTGTQAVPPTVKTNSNGTVVLNSQSIVGETVEYSLGTTTTSPINWQTSTSFRGLATGNYYFFARVRETPTHLAGEIAISNVVYVDSTPTTGGNFNVELYINSSQSNVMSKNIELYDTLSINVWENLSVLTGSFLLTAFPDYSRVNYLKREDNDQYYFITDWTVERGGFVRANCRLDPLMTYRTEILQNSGIVERNTTLYNSYLNDGNLQVEQRTQTVTKAFPYKFTDNGTYILAVAGGGQ